MFFHADNCVGQNKNNCMVQYLAWRTIIGIHKKITLSFLVVGHTKFAPDWCFGLLKQKYRKTKIGGLKDLSKVVNESATCNFSQLVSQEDGTSTVQVYDWTSFFAPNFKKITGIKKLHHFRFDHTHKGSVFVKEQCDSEEKEIKLLSHTWHHDSSELPAIIPPKGLSAERKWYLYDNICQFCPEDITCPKPDVPKLSSRAADMEFETELLDESAIARPSIKRRQCCTTCNQHGHNSRTCPNNKED